MSKPVVQQRVVVGSRRRYEVRWWAMSGAANSGYWRIWDNELQAWCALPQASNIDRDLMFSWQGRAHEWLELCAERGLQMTY